MGEELWAGGSDFGCLGAAAGAEPFGLDFVTEIRKYKKEPV